jgi:hypothetical protein
MLQRVFIGSLDPSTYAFKLIGSFLAEGFAVSCSKFQLALAKKHKPCGPK